MNEDEGEGSKKVSSILQNEAERRPRIQMRERTDFEEVFQRPECR